MESLDYLDDSQIDSLVEYDDSMKAFVKDSICPDEEEEEQGQTLEETKQGQTLEDAGRDKARTDVVVEDAGRDKARTDVVEEECMIVDDTFFSEDDMVSVDAVKEEEVQSTAGNGENVLLVKGKDSAIMVNDDEEICVIYDDDIGVIYDDEFVVNDKAVMVAQDCHEEKGLCSSTLPANYYLDQTYGEDVILASKGKEDRDFDLNKLPLLGIFTFTDPFSEKRFIEIMRKYQSKYY